MQIGRKNFEKFESESKNLAAARQYIQAIKHLPSSYLKSTAYKLLIDSARP